jgi:hypothetical protein
MCNKKDSEQVGMTDQGILIFNTMESQTSVCTEETQAIALATEQVGNPVAATRYTLTVLTKHSRQLFTRRVDLITKLYVRCCNTM